MAYVGTYRALLAGGVSRPALVLDFIGLNVLDPRITFSRGSNATLTDSTGKITYAPANLLTYSEQFDNAAWTKGVGYNSTITANAATAPNGSMTADALVADSGGGTGNVIVARTQAVSAGTSYVLSIYAKANTLSWVRLYLLSYTAPANGGAYFDLANGAVGTVDAGYTAGITSVGNGWYRCSLYFPTTSATVTGEMRIWLANSNGNTAVARNGTSSVYIWGAQLEPVTYQTTPGTYQATTSSAYYGPRFDYDPVTLAAKGLLIEEQRTNLLTYSEQFDNAAWTKASATVTANAATSLDGMVNADKLNETAVTDTHYVYQAPTLSAITYTFSVYVKAAERTFAKINCYRGVEYSGYVNLTTGAITSLAGGATLTATNVGNGWWRCNLVFTVAAGGSCDIGVLTAISGSSVNYAGTAGSGIYIWGAQLEAGSFATSYIPTVASTVTRSADVATMTGTNFSGWYNQSEGTFVVDGDRITVSLFSYPLLASDGTFANRFGIYTSGSSAAGFVVSSSATQMDISASSIVANVPFRSAVAAQTNNGNFSFNGNIGTTDTTITMPVVNRLTIGAGFVGTGEYINGHIRSIAYYNTRLPNSQLQALTT